MFNHVVVLLIVSLAVVVQAGDLKVLPELSLDLQTDDLAAVMSRWTLGGDAEVQDDKVYLTRNEQVRKSVLFSASLVISRRTAGHV